MFIKIVNSERDFAQNGPTGITINTGTRYFAAVLLQEYYEFWRYAFWFWVAPAAIAVAGYFIYPLLSLASLILMVLVGSKTIKFEDREAMGQAIEIAAIKVFYGRLNMDSEYRLQARSLIRKDSPYKAKGYWSDIPAIDPAAYTNDMAIAGVSEPSIDKMISKLKAKAPAAERYVKKHYVKLEKWRPMGEESKGY